MQTIKSTFTPGPWQVVPNMRYPSPVRVSATSCADGAVKIADCFHSATYDGLANARLIASCPDLLAACEHAAKSCHHPACKCKGEYLAFPEQYCTCHVQKARKAIAKARG